MSDKSSLAKPMVDILLQAGVGISDIQIIELAPKISPLDYQVAMKLADEKAQQISGEVMLLSWYDRDRDFESPQYSSECPGQCDSGLCGLWDFAWCKVNDRHQEWTFYFFLYAG